MSAHRKFLGLFSVLLIVALACNSPTSPAVEPTEAVATVEPQAAAPTEAPQGEEDSAADSSPAVVHELFPASDVPRGKSGVDVESSGTGPEGRAPYGDSYDISLLERPFLQNMTYVPDLDIAFFSISQDDEFYYVSIRLIGDDPNNPLGIVYAVELDLDRDGFGDFIVWANPPYSEEWTADNVQVFADLNKDSGGRSAVKSDAIFLGDGYETLIHDITQGVGDDPDLAWVRTFVDGSATVQIAFKRSLAGDVFMYGVLADAGLKDVTMFDYVDRFTEAQAGSPVRNKKDFPLQALHSVDTTCREGVGFTLTGFEPRACSPIVQPSAGGGGSSDSGPVCADPMITASNCAAQGLNYWPPPHCACSSTPYTP